MRMGAPHFSEPFPHPIPKLIRDISEHLAANGELIAVKAEESDHPLGLLEWLKHAVDKHTIEAPVAGPDAMLRMLVARRSWVFSRVVKILRSYSMHALYGLTSQPR
jgi:hypothetical protein